MKKLFTLSVLAFLLASLGHRALAQTCTGNYEFHLQTQIDAFNCAVVNGNLTIRGFGSDITNLDGLSELTTVTGYLNMIGHESLTDISGLSNLTSVGQYLWIGNNTILPNLSGLGSLTSVGQFLWIIGNDALTDISDLSSLTSVGGDLSINNNNSLTSLSGLDELTSVGGEFEMASNSNLTSLNGLSKFTSVGGDVIIQQNPGLTSISGLSGLTSVPGRFQISSSALTSLSSLGGNLTSVGGTLSISSNAALMNLDGLEGLTSVAGDNLSILANPVLTSLSGLSGLTSVDAFLVIQSNDALTSLSGLDNINPNSMDGLALNSNNNLSTCEVQPICNYLAVPSNSASISGNASNCASRLAVETACAAALPVELVDFKATLSKDHLALLTWRTASEYNNEGFEVERLAGSANGNAWHKMGFVAGSGTTQEEQRYTFTDERPEPGINYYRLKQMDYDGQYEYSKVSSILLDGGTDRGIKAYPNPVQNGLLNINFATKQEGFATLRIFDTNGKMLHQETLADQYNQTGYGHLPAGVYLIEVMSKSNAWRERLVVVE